MKYYKIEATITCPDDWTPEDCRVWVAGRLSTQEEKLSVRVLAEPTRQTNGEIVNG